MKISELTVYRLVFGFRNIFSIQVYFQYQLLKFENPHLVDVKVVDRIRISEGSESETLPAKTTVMKDISRNFYNAIETPKLFYAKGTIVFKMPIFY